MKLIIFSFFILTLFASCGNQTNVFQDVGETTALKRGLDNQDPSSDRLVFAKSNVRAAPGVVHLKSKGIGKNTADATTQAKLNAIKAVLFKGIPESNVSAPLVDLKARKKHKDFFKNFLKEGGDFLDYVVNTQPNAEDRVKMKKAIQIGIFIEINYKQLQKRLEDEGINKAFGIN